MKQKLAILLALLALGTSQPLAAIQASESSEISTSAVNNSQDESPSKEKGSRQNPIPVGEAYDYVRKSRDGAESHLSFSILESWRGAKAEKQLQKLAPSYQATRQPLDDDQELLIHFLICLGAGFQMNMLPTCQTIWPLICCLYILVMSMMAIWSQLFPKILRLFLVISRAV